MPLADRLRALRKALGWTQEELAEKAALRRTDVVRLESGANKGGSVAIRQALASAFDLTLEQTNAYLDGLTEINTTLERMRAKDEPRAMSPFDVAVAYLGDMLSPEAIARGRAWAQTQHEPLPARIYGEKLIEIQRELLERLPTGSHVRKKKAGPS